MTLKEIYKKYDIYLRDFERLYRIQMNQRRYDVEFSTPRYFIFDDMYTIEDASWVSLLQKVVSYLQSRNPLDCSILFEYKTEWSNSYIFYDTPRNVNCKQVEDNLYITTNHTALHDLWLLQDLLTLYGMDGSKCFCFIHKANEYEPEEVRIAVEEHMKLCFSDFLRSKGLSNEQVDKTTKGIYSLNKILKKLNCSRNNIFLADSRASYSNLKSLILTNYKKCVAWSDKQLALAEKCLSYYSSFLKYYSESVLRINPWYDFSDRL